MDYISSFMKFTTRYLLLKSVSKPEAEIRDWDWLGFSDWLERKACADLSVLVYGTLRYNEIKDNCPCGQLCKSFPVSVKHCVDFVGPNNLGSQDNILFTCRISFTASIGMPNWMGTMAVLIQSLSIQQAIS